VCGQMDGQTDRKTDTKDLSIAFRNFAKVLKNVMINHQYRTAVLKFLCHRTPLTVQRNLQTPPQ